MDLTTGATPIHAEASVGTLLADVDAFLRRHGATINETDFGRMAASSTQFVSSLRHGRKVGAALEERVRAAMVAYRPQPKTRTQRNAAKYGEAVRRNQEELRAASAFRLTDQVEMAKTFIRSRGWHTFNAEITRPEHAGKFFIGPNLYTKEEMLEFARRKGFKG